MKYTIRHPDTEPGSPERGDYFSTLRTAISTLIHPHLIARYQQVCEESESFYGEIQNPYSYLQMELNKRTGEDADLRIVGFDSGYGVSHLPAFAYPPKPGSRDSFSTQPQPHYAGLDERVDEIQSKIQALAGEYSVVCARFDLDSTVFNGQELSTEGLSESLLEEAETTLAKHRKMVESWPERQAEIKELIQSLPDEMTLIEDAHERDSE